MQDNCCRKAKNTSFLAPVLGHKTQFAPRFLKATYVHGRQANVSRWDIFWLAWEDWRSERYSCLLSIYVPYLLVRRKNTFISTLIYGSEIKKVVIFLKFTLYKNQLFPINYSINIFHLSVDFKRVSRN